MGRDVQTLIHQQAPLPAARACDIVTQVASALDAAHAHGLVHRDVKPGNMLRDATSGRAQPDHVYLSDFGLSKQSLGTAAALTAQGQFLGTLNYVAPEQIEGRSVDGRTDEYALACSAFEMLAGQTPFRRDDSLAIMWAQLSDAPPSLTGIRQDLPAAVDGVMARALSKAPDDRYGTCLEFATALRQACGIRTGSTAPGKIVPGARRDPRGAAGRARRGQRCGGGQRGRRPAAGPACRHRPDRCGRAGRPRAGGRRGRRGRNPHRHGPGPAGRSERLRAADGGQPTQVGRVPGVRPTKPGLTDPMGDYGQLYRPSAPPAAPPARRSRRTLAIVLAACVVVAAAGGAYLLLGRGGGGGGGGGGQTGTATRVLTLPGCTTATARAAPLRGVRTHFAQVGGKPFDVVVSPNNFGFVSLRNNAPLVVMNTAKFVPTVVQQVPLANPEGEAFTHNRQYLLVAGDSGMTVFRVRDLEAGLTTPVGSLTSPGGKGALQVVPSPDDKFAFVALQNSGNVAVFNLHKALTAGFGPADFVGMIPMRSDPTGMAASPDGRYLYVASGLAGTALQSGMGTLAIVDMRKAETSPGSSVVKEDNAGCGPARVLASPDGKYVWVTSGGGNALEAFSAAKLLSDSRHALVAKVEVGQIPLGLALVGNGTRMVVADSNRDSVGTSTADLMVVDVDKALAGKPALVGTIKSGLAPRQFALEPNGKTLLVTNTSSGQVEAVNVGQIP